MASASHDRRRRTFFLLKRVPRAALFGIVVLSLFSGGVAAQELEIPADSSAHVPPPILADTAAALADTVPHAADTAVVPFEEAFDDETPRHVPSVMRPPHASMDSARRALDRRLVGLTPPMPRLQVLAAGDLADWLGLFGAYDVDDAPGAGQNRFFTRWGLTERQGHWRVGGRPFLWQRLSFPQRAQFDPGVLPSFPYEEYRIGDRVQLVYDTAWGATPRSSYFYRQGDFTDTYSEGRFRRRFGRRFGLDLNFTFFNSDGRYALDDRSLRNLRFQAIGPVRGDLFWSYRFMQFRDETIVLVPESPHALSSVTPRRDDLLWQMEWNVYRPDASTAGWLVGLEVQSGKQRISDDAAGYLFFSRDQRWALWGERTVAGWVVDAEGIWEKLKIDPVSRNRWGLRVTAGRIVPLGTHWSVLINVGVTDWDNDPVGVEVTGELAPPPAWTGFIPTLRGERRRVVPTLFDRYRPTADPLLTLASATYSESGTPDLDAQWENALSLKWSAGSPEGRPATGPALLVEARAAYVENYTDWADTSTVESRIFYRPLSRDVRSAGVTAGFSIPMFRDFALVGNYTVKYAASLSEEKLFGYYPHKATAILSWDRTQLRWGFGVRANVIGFWAYGDRRINPTNYTEPHIFRLDVSGAAILEGFTFNYLVQNILNFQYRTRAGYPMTGRTVRFGIEWHFLN